MNRKSSHAQNNVDYVSKYIQYKHKYINLKKKLEGLSDRPRVTMGGAEEKEVEDFNHGELDRDTAETRIKDSNDPVKIGDYLVRWSKNKKKYCISFVTKIDCIFEDYLTVPTPSFKHNLIYQVPGGYSIVNPLELDIVNGDTKVYENIISLIAAYPNILKRCIKPPSLS